MKRIIIIIISIMVIAGCDNKQSIKIRSTDTLSTVSKKINFVYKSEHGNYDTYQTPDELNAIDDIKLPSNILRKTIYYFSKNGDFCEFYGDASTYYGEPKEVILRTFKEMKNDLDRFGVAKKDEYDNLHWNINKSSGIKNITLSLNEYEHAIYLRVRVTTDAKRYCDPKVMEQEKKGKWMTNEFGGYSYEASYEAAIYSEPDSQDKKSTLSIICMENRLLIFLSPYEKINSKKPSVSLQVANNKPLIDHWHINTEQNLALYTGDVKSLFKKMLETNRLTAKLETESGRITSTFDIDKMSYATKDIIKACKID